MKDLLVRLLVPLPRPTWLALALLLPVGVLLVALVLRVLIGSPVGPTSAMPWTGVIGASATLLATRFFLGGGLGEELGWRGVMLPALQHRLGAFRASLVIGLAHGAWHFPAYGFGTLFLIPFTVSGALIFTWMYNRTGGNLLLPALMHASANASLPALEVVLPGVDQELLLPLLVSGVWVASALLIVWRVGIEGLGPSASTGSNESGETST